MGLTDDQCNEIISDSNFKNFSCYLLNSTISSLRRKKIIEEIKDKSKKERIIIVSTQSIEAGVDIDCDFGVRDYSILDSIEQISGRINRECNMRKSNTSKLFVIMYKDGSISDSEKIYRSYDRYKIQNLDFNQDDIEEILTYKKFNKYYNVLSKNLKRIARDNFLLISREIRDLHFKTINDDLNVIDQRVDQIDIFVCDEIPLKNLSEYDKNKIESIIVDSVIMKFEGIQKIISGEVIFTKNVYVVWKQIMGTTNKFYDVYIRRKITSLFNQFIITITNLKNEKTNLYDYLEAEGFIERDDKFNIILSTQKFSECYNFTDGIKTDKFKEGMDNLSLGIII
ncbi:CRISPR-associated nuclease/helicase Cas3 [uncultured archaeon]|nr:CRISPR-associated nuclease/helicase Cas3 [uncultured archaeon]